MLTRIWYSVALLMTVICANSLFAQGSSSLLATAAGFRFTDNDLSPEAKRLFDDQTKLIADHRKAVFNEWIFEQLLELEAKSRSTTVAKIEEESLTKIPKPTEAQITAVYDANRETIGSRLLDEVRGNIIDYLRRQAEDNQRAALNDSLKAKYKYAAGKDVGTVLKTADVAATIGTRQIAVGEFQFANRIALYNYRADIHEEIKASLENAIYEKLLEAEAKKRNSDPSSVIAAEITNKLKDYTDYERMYLEDMFQAKLFADHGVKFILPALEPQSLNVSADDDPSIGNASAKVTVVAFVDFQCSACAAFSPLMKQVAAEFGAGVRIVVRDFPLTGIHEHAMAAALAGYAARQQGKFFEMADLMYRNQSELDAESINGYARQLGLNMEQFERDARSEAAAAEIRKDAMDGKTYGVAGTPTVFVNGVRLQRLSTGRLRALIKNALRP